MEKPTSTMARDLGQVASAMQRRRTGHASKSVAVVLSQDTLVITLQDALSPAEKDLAKSPAGVAQVQEFHRHLFANDSGALREAIEKITGVAVREAGVEVDTTKGAVVQVFPTGTMVQVFLLAGSVLADAWSGSGVGWVMGRQPLEPTFDGLP